MAAMNVTKIKLVKRLERCEGTLGVLIDAFLMSNRRIDRDKVIKKREEIRTLKYVINEFF